MKPVVKNTLKYIAFAGLAALLLFLAFRSADPQKLWADLKNAHYGWVLASMAMGYAAIVSRGYRWRLLLEPLGYRPSFWNSVNSVSVLYFVNLALPRAGEVARCTSLNQVEDIPVNKLFGTVLLERAVDFLYLIVVMLFAIGINAERFTSLFDRAFAADPGTEESGLAVWKWLVVGFLAIGAVVLLLLRKRIIASPAFAKIRDFYSGLKEGFKAIFQMKKQFAFWFHTTFIWANYFFMVYVCFFAIDETAHLTLADGFFIMVAASLGIVVPVPGGIGAYHYLVSLALVVIGLSYDVGLSFATIVHSAQTLMLFGTGALAMLFLYLERRRKRVQ